MLLDNLKIDYNPVVLSNTLFNIVAHKTDVQGYWVDDKNKLYIDNIELIEYGSINTVAFNNKKQLLFKEGEKCIFYKDIYNQGIIQYANGTWDILKNRIAWIENRKPSKKYILELLKNNGGLTVYKLENKNYLIEMYK